MGNEFDFDSFCVEHNIILKINQNLGSRIRGFCYYDGLYYYIVLNNRISFEQQQITLIHEIIHIFQNHFFYPSQDSDVCEVEVHNILHDLKDAQQYLETHSCATSI